jgi:hypothetical protein
MALARAAVRQTELNRYRYPLRILPSSWLKDPSRNHRPGMSMRLWRLELMFDSGHRMSLLDSNYWSGQSLARKLPVHHQANCLAREARGCMAFIS